MDIARSLLYYLQKKQAAQIRQAYVILTGHRPQLRLEKLQRVA
jgi:hypothetical protein